MDRIKQGLLFYVLVAFVLTSVRSELTPPYFNLAEGRKITATATCGVDTDGPELYCKLVGANTENDHQNHYSVIQGQVCDVCDPSDPEKNHPPEYAIDGTQNWWQSPPLSRGMKYNEVNLTIDFDQEFHVAYLFIRMGNSPRPGLWSLEKSSDYGKTWTPWQHFSDSPADCVTFFGANSLKPLQHDDDVICTMEHSKIVPLEGGEIPIRLLNNRPSANNYFNSSTLQEWSRATNIRIRLLRTKNLLGHLMSVARQDPTVTRRYFYSIKDISIGGRCVCNGHANTCNVLDPRSPTRILACQCQHNTCGIQCAECCPGYEQKKWHQNTNARPFQCEPCNCHGHSNECVYSEDVDIKGLSLDVNGNYEGGGVCQNCQHNTKGINCNQCQDKFFRPRGKFWNETDVCEACNCDHFYSTGNCEEETGRCECRVEFQPPYCDSCSYGHFGYPNCRPCECNLNATVGYYCEAVNGACPCKPNFDGAQCKQCAKEYYQFPSCEPCECNMNGAIDRVCNEESGQCKCKPNFSGRVCESCKNGFYSYPECTYCNCDVRGTLEEVCDKSTGSCLCREGYSGPRCDQCMPGYFNYPDCVPCNCSSAGSTSTICDVTGRCSCLDNFGGRQCTACLAGYYQYPECLPCNCNSYGSSAKSCTSEGQCQCKDNFDGKTCQSCREGFYNFPACEECNCDPAGVIARFAGCGSVPAGELCQCKERVHGRICDKCRPLYWNLTATNPHGCQDCECFIDGTIGALDTCDTKTGQCACKPSVKGRQCAECKDGTFDLFGSSLFGCKDCGCDIGGAANKVCNKETGQCRCHPRVSGRTCSFPLTTHYYPTLYQFQFEYEDGYTQSGAQVRYQFHEDIFPEFSSRGYAVMSSLQNEIFNEVNVVKSSVYRLVIRYKNPNAESIIATILITPDNPTELEQKTKVLFKPNEHAEFVTVSDARGDVPSPVVLDPGSYTISIKTDKTLFLDYFVLLPAAYYEASILTKRIENPCEISDHGLCRHYQYPSINMYSPQSEAFIVEDEQSFKPAEYFKDYEHMDVVRVKDLPILTNTQPELFYPVQVTHAGRYVIVIDYITNRNNPDVVILQINLVGDIDQDGSANTYPCMYTMVCRQPVIDKESREKIFFLDPNSAKPIHVTSHDLSGTIAIKSITAIPFEDWATDYIRPKSVCVMQNGNCVKTSYTTAPDSKKIEFETGNEHRIASDLPNDQLDNSTKLILLDKQYPDITINASLMHPNRYVIIIKYFQPDHPLYTVQYRVATLMQNYDGRLEVRHCPANSGCQEVLKQDNGNVEFDLQDNIEVTILNSGNQRLWVDYVQLVPADQFNDGLLREEMFDQTIEFIQQCGQNHFYIQTNASELCRKAVFSLTADYNSGALPCNCDYAGSTSFECEPFGGQCQCKPHIIGRKCEACKTGYYGFPDCKPCNCPSTAQCHKDTGDCVCPDRVTGEKCDSCVPYTFGFDQIIGCEECNCNPLGVANNNLQCDMESGLCECKSNVVDRKCDRCQYGFFNFPYCEPCHCDIRGTTFEICDQSDESCYCKKNVQGRECNTCVDGTYNLQASNPDGCTKCFCFGHSSRCHTAFLRPFNVSMMKSVTVNKIRLSGGKAIITPYVMDNYQIMLNETTAEVALSSLGSEDVNDSLIYFGMIDHLFDLNSHLSAYGGYLTYSIHFTNGLFGSAIIGADIILESKHLEIMHQSYRQPSANQIFNGIVEMVEGNFQTTSGGKVSREQFMLVLRDLKNIFIRASYWENGLVTTISDVSLTMAHDDLEHPQHYRELAVESCECPPGYMGRSCEDCAPGYYRDPNGPYLGYCIPCECNGHAATCDCNTGICHECQHYTMGDHCDQCIEGYYGNATRGTPNDCMICACPLPVESNNFATACEVSEDGYEIHCACKPGYYGEKCQSCAAGYYGQPQIEGEFCKPCDCSGNINAEEPGACDSVSGECLLCLNNTSGRACNLCAPGFYGDAVRLKDCQSCICDKIGMDYCDNFIGTCNCLPNVIGEKCDRCEDDHYGFESGRGCSPCGCGIASNSTQCDDHNGKCACKPGVTGRQCDRCDPGYWNYSAEGCTPCSCNTDYSRGLGCNSETGQCECLSGVVGEKCDSCPYRWVLIPETGCHECDVCHHALLDVSDELKGDLDPVLNDIETIADDYYTSQKLKYYDDMVDKLEPKVRSLDPHGVNLNPSRGQVELLEIAVKNLDRRIHFADANAKDISINSEQLLASVYNVLDDCRIVNINTKSTIGEVAILAANLGSSEVTKLEQAIEEANNYLENIKQYSTTDESLNAQLENATRLLMRVEEFGEPVQQQNDKLIALIDEIGVFDVRLEDLYNWSLQIEKESDITSKLSSKNKESANTKFDTVSAHAKEANDNIENSKLLLGNTTNIMKDIEITHIELDHANKELTELNDGLDKELPIADHDYQKLNPLIEKASAHAVELKIESESLSDKYSDVSANSETALKAATAHSNIVTAVSNADDDIRNATSIARSAKQQTQGIDNRAAESDSTSRELLNDAGRMFTTLQTDLEPHSKRSIQTVEDINRKNEQSDEMLHSINAALDGIPEESHTDRWENARDQAIEAQAKSQNSLKILDPMASDLSKSVYLVEQLPKEVDNTQKDIKQASTQIDRFKTMIPNIRQLVEKLDKKQNQVDSIVSDIGDRLESLKRQIGEARAFANTIRVGMLFHPNTTVELKPPKSLSHMATNSNISVFFRTDKTEGFLLYLGNEIKPDTKKSSRDDYMALEIENGYPVLSVDLGSDPEKVINPKYVADNKWYQAIIDRSGNNIKLTIREELTNGTEVFHTKDQSLPGSYNVFNVDQNSKLFIGGYPPEYNMPQDVKSSEFDGRMEQLQIGGDHVGLWNFIDGQNVYGSQERDTLRNEENPSTGFRFGGKGYVAIDAKPFGFKHQSQIQFQFKAPSDTKDGLMFYAGRSNHFISVELRNGAILYQFKLGQQAQVVTIGSKSAFNDDKWHKVSAERDGNVGKLTVDDQVVFQQTGTAEQPQLHISEAIYFGGYHSRVNHSQVTSKGFDGCIDDVYILGNRVDLSFNTKALDVRPGCPMKFSPLVSFLPEQLGYASQQGVTTVNGLQLNLKFRTTRKDGVLFYTSNYDQSGTFGLAMRDGLLVLTSSSTEFTSDYRTYNDGEWHVVTAAHDKNHLTLTIDDRDPLYSSYRPESLFIENGDIYFGGFPKNYVTPSNAIASNANFIGCIKDVTVNGQIVNFAAVSDKKSIILDDCPKELFIDSGVAQSFPNVVKPLDPKAPETEQPKSTSRPQISHEPSSNEISTVSTSTDTTTATTVPTVRARVSADEVGPICKLPVTPEQDVDFDSGYRFGTGQFSHIEFNEVPLKNKRHYDYSLSFKTEMPEGVLFYAADTRHTDFIALHLHNGRVYHTFNCGSGSANMSSERNYNDNEWHTVHFMRQNSKGKLIIDGEDESSAESTGSTRTMAIQAPIYVGGVSSDNYEEVALNLKIDKNVLERNQFVGCVHGIQSNGRPLETPSNITRTIPCSSRIETGTFFGDGGGFVKLYDKFKVGNELTVSMDIRPRALSGLLMSVHGRKAYFVLEMINGTIRLTVNNGDDPFTATYIPLPEENLCDGQWRTVSAIKSQYVITIKVNDVSSNPAIGDARNPSTDTTRPLFLGGHPHLQRIRGFVARAPFQGCIRNVKIRDSVEQITPKMIVGNVQTGVCPTI
ncbi:laminin subunit alpha isoform X1 [Anopheles aquasalis]|uniref:laminin subunit alpha isoform X1 n=2 Tax=Anopheles aquasalis TaxID=42839 RepID=UPI00215A6A1F|nr:laminin subunit alpha isoform X1 [Anopheles aquasalis]XP_050097932.1 laminin subunit alpha isoform X1 [Anopheles aquasalis]XP_050097933.1 laminin subunit alpha isoform X1 [Anopheles aquasalis]